jgi:hypothetical protein
MLCPIKLTYRPLSLPGKQFKNQPNPEDDLPIMAKSRKMTYRDWPNSALRQAGISKVGLMKPA